MDTIIYMIILLMGITLALSGHLLESFIIIGLTYLFMIWRDDAMSKLSSEKGTEDTERTVMAWKYWDMLAGVASTAGYSDLVDEHRPEHGANWKVVEERTNQLLNAIRERNEDEMFSDPSRFGEWNRIPMPWETED